VSSPEQREVSPPEGGLSNVSIPEVIQSPDPEEFLPEENFLGDFERAYLDRRLNRRSPELKRTRSPSVRRGQPVNEPSGFQRVVRSRTATRSPSPGGFKPSARGQPRTPAGRGAFQSPLQTRARGRSSSGEGRVHEERLPVPAGRHLSNDQQGRACSFQVQGHVPQALCSLSNFSAGGTPTRLCESILKTQDSRRAESFGARNGLK
jgi:hypothetical protein